MWIVHYEARHSLVGEWHRESLTTFDKELALRFMSWLESEPVPSTFRNIVLEEK